MLGNPEKSPGLFNRPRPAVTFKAPLPQEQDAAQADSLNNLDLNAIGKRIRGVQDHPGGVCDPFDYFH